LIGQKLIGKVAEEMFVAGAPSEDRLTVCVAIPTYQREGVLVETIRQVLTQDSPADEVLVIDQSADHEFTTSQALSAWHQEGWIRWIKHSPPNLPGARNRALLESRSDIVIFIDDDVILSPGFVEAHRRSYDDPRIDLVAGQVLNKDRQVHTGAVKDHELQFPRNHGERAWIKGVFGGNHSVRRRLALEVGGFDERYVQNAFREETDFAFRATAQSRGMVLFEPKASLAHLKMSTGGCRAWDILRMLNIGWTTGDYYFALKTLTSTRWAGHIAKGSFHRLINRYSAGHPWVIPLFLIREAVGLTRGAVFAVQNRKLISSPASRSRIAKQEP